MRNSIFLKYSLTAFLFIAFIDQAVSQNENFELTKADSLAYNDSTSAVDFETYLANLKLEKKKEIERAEPDQVEQSSEVFAKSASQNQSASMMSTVTLTFTNAGATGHEGPTQNQINTAYSGTTLESKVTINTQGIQEWTVPAQPPTRSMPTAARAVELLPVKAPA